MRMVVGGEVGLVVVGWVLGGDCAVAVGGRWGGGWGGRWGGGRVAGLRVRVLEVGVVAFGPGAAATGWGEG